MHWTAAAQPGGAANHQRSGVCPCPCPNPPRWSPPLLSGPCLCLCPQACSLTGCSTSPTCSPQLKRPWCGPGSSMRNMHIVAVAVVIVRCRCRCRSMVMATPRVPVRPKGKGGLLIYALLLQTCRAQGIVLSECAPETPCVCACRQGCPSAAGHWEQMGPACRPAGRVTPTRTRTLAPPPPPSPPPAPSPPPQPCFLQPRTLRPCYPSTHPPANAPHPHPPTHPCPLLPG